MKAAKEVPDAAWSMTAQNSDSKEMEVRCPWMERERFCRSLVMVKFTGV